MDNKLPTDDKQKNFNSPETLSASSVNPPSSLEDLAKDISETKPQVIPEVPEEELPKTSSETSPSPETTTSNEPTIEIGSLDQPSSVIQNTGNSKPSSKAKKTKTFVSVLGILLILAALPLSIILVKQNQDIRKKASESQPAFNDISINFESETSPSSANGGTYSTTFKVKNTVSSQRTVVVEKKSCYCLAGKPSGGCEDNCSSENATLTLGGNQSTNVTISARQPDGNVCGSFQTDLTVLSVK